MASYKAKIGWKRLRKRENKNYRSVSFLPDMLYKIPKKQKKNLENKKIPLWHHFKSKEVGKGREREKIKNIIPFRSCPTHNRKLQKKQQKNSIN